MKISTFGICLSTFLIMSFACYVVLGSFDLRSVYEIVGRIVLCMWVGLGITAAIFGVVINSKERNE